MTGGAWDTLGISHTGDVAAIRKAYSRRLKEIDVEGDPDAFVALHAAYRHALREAGPRDRPAEAPPPGDGPLIPDEAAPDPPAEDPAWPPAARDATPPPHLRLEALLYGEPGSAPDADALRATVTEILASPDMENVDHAGRAEMWLAETAYRAIPRSDPIAPMIVRHFNWERNEGRIDQPPALDVLIARARDQERGEDLLGLVEDPEHPMHEAYCSLMGWGPEVDSQEIRAIGGDVSRLLKVIRARAPAAESMLDRKRVALWDERLGSTPRPVSWEGAERTAEPDRGPASGGKNPGKLLLGIMILLMLSRIAACLPQPH